MLSGRKNAFFSGNTLSLAFFPYFARLRKILIFLKNFYLVKRKVFWEILSFGYAFWREIATFTVFQRKEGISQKNQTFVYKWKIVLCHLLLRQFNRFFSDEIFQFQNGLVAFFAAARTIGWWGVEKYKEGKDVFPQKINLDEINKLLIQATLPATSACFPGAILMKGAFWKDGSFLKKRLLQEPQFEVKCTYIFLQILEVHSDFWTLGKKLSTFDETASYEPGEHIEKTCFPENFFFQKILSNFEEVFGLLVKSSQTLGGKYFFSVVKTKFNVSRGSFWRKPFIWRELKVNIVFGLRAKIIWA